MILRIVFLFFLFLSSSQIFAREVPESIQILMDKLSLKFVATGEPFVYPGVHAIYEDHTSGRFALALFDMEGDIRKTQIIRAADYYIVQLPSGRGKFHSLAISGFDKSQLDFIISSTVPTRSWSFSFFASAHASDIPCDPNLMDEMALKNFEQLQATTDTSYLEMAKSCALSAVQGVWEATGGLVQSIWGGLVSLVTEPRAFWDRRVAEYRAIKDFVSEFDARIQEAMASLKMLPKEVLVDIICGFAGEVAAGLIIGGGIVTIGPKISLYLAKIAKMAPALFNLNKLGEIKSIPKEFYKKLAKGDIPDERLESIGTFGKYEMSDMAKGAISCSL